MRLKHILLASIATCALPLIAYAQMVPGTGPMVPAPVNPIAVGPINAVPYYAVAGNKLTPIPSVPNAVFITSSGGIPGWTGTFSGNTTKFATASGALTSGTCATWDVSGNIISTGTACSSSSGSVNPGVINQMGWYASTGSTISGLPTANNGVLVTDAGGAPSIGTTLPTLVQSNITQLGTITTGVWNGTIITVPFGGTGAGTFTLNGALYGNGTSAIQATAQGGANTVLAANSGAPFFTSSPTVSSITANTAINAPYMNTGSVVFVDILDSKLNTDSSFSYNSGPHELTVPTLDLSTLVVMSGLGVGHGTATLVAPDSTFTNYQMSLPTTPGSAGQPLLSGGGGSPPMTWGALSGNTSTFATASGPFTSGTCATWDSNGNIISTGTACASGGGVNPGTVNDLGWYSSTGSTISALPTANNGILATSAGGVPSIATTLPTLVQGNITTLGTIGTGTWQGSTIAAIYGGTGLSSFTSGGLIYAPSSTTLASSIAIPLNQPILGGGIGGAPVSGTASGNTTTFATVNGLLTPGSCLEWDNNGNVLETGFACGQGTINSGLINQVAWYAANGTQISGLPTGNNSVLITSNTGVPSITSALPTLVQSNITTLGTITVGVWNGTAITVPFGGTGITSGTSGGILYFNSTTTMASSALLTSGLPVVGGGAGAAPVSGTRSGSTTAYANFSGTPGATLDFASWDGAGAVKDSGIPLSSVVYAGTDGGTANAHTITGGTSSNYVLSTNTLVATVLASSNTGATTLNINGTGVKNVFKETSAGASALTGGELVSGNTAVFSYDGTQYQLLNPPTTTKTTTFNLGGTYSFSYQRGTSRILVILFGAGGGGGAGAVSGTTATGGGGAGGGQRFSSGFLPISNFPASPISVVVGTGGSGGVGSGVSGTNGTDTTFGSLFTAFHGAGGNGAGTGGNGKGYGALNDSTGNSLQIAGNPVSISSYTTTPSALNGEMTGGAGGNGIAAAAGTNGGTSLWGGGGGGGGGSKTAVAENVGGAGGITGVNQTIHTGGGSGGAGGAVCGSGTAGSSNGPFGGTGGGGSGSCPTVSSTGGAGGFPGGGGGGSGAGATGVGNGGTGADGEAIIIEQ